ncbi:MAG: S8 family serine peptidase [Chloroflexi bacterium]|nr:S8 family serine peptidase [Chloroflexota bacterium]
MKEPAVNANLARLLLPLFVLASSFASPAPAAGRPEPVQVLVTFDRPPGEIQTSLVEGMGGQVLEIYRLVPAALVRISESALPALAASNGVVAVEPDATVGGLGQVLPAGVDRINAELVHPYNKGAGVKIAILDTGIDLNHPDLRVAGQVSFVAGAATAQDDHGHGTMVAGIIAALDNDIGVVGVAPEAQIYAVKVLRADGSGSVSDIIKGVQWAVDNGMQVVNMSFGGGSWPWVGEQALSNAYNAGIVLVAGSGSQGRADGSGDNVNYPARYNNVVAVGAVDGQNNRLPGSSTGYALELAAPGLNIYTTARGGGYGFFGNTSAAAAHVSGAAALLIRAGVAGNLEVRRRLRDTALDLGSPGWDTRYGKGLINVSRAIIYHNPPDRASPYSAMSPGGIPGNQGWYRSEIAVNVQPTDWPAGSGIAETRYSLDGGTTWNLYASPLVISGDGRTTLLVRSWDREGNDEGPPNVLPVKIDKTAPAVRVSASPAITLAARPGDTFSLTVDAYAEDMLPGSGLGSSSLKVADEYGVYNVDYGPVRPIVAILEAWARPEDKGGRLYTIVATATDVAGNTAIATTTVAVVHGDNRNSQPAKVDPGLTLTASPRTVAGGDKGTMFSLNITARARAARPDMTIASSSLKISDEYGVYTRELGPVGTRAVELEAWAGEMSEGGRSYTITATATDSAGNSTTVSTAVIVTPRASPPTVDGNPPGPSPAPGRR